MILKISILFLTIFSCQFSFAQNEQEELPTADSSLVIKKKKEKKTKKSSFDYSTLDPKKATIYSILPGLGQAYNHRYWKIPVIYGLGGMFGYFIYNNHKKYQNYNDGLNFVQDTANPNHEDFFKVDSGDILYESQLQQGQDQFKRQRDFNFILLLAVYGLQIVDANVDAHLLKFHNSENFLSLSPTVINDRSNYSPGLSLALHLR
jgi:hypothetical protein